MPDSRGLMLRALKFMRLSDAEVRRAWTAVRGRGAVVHRGDPGIKTARKHGTIDTGYCTANVLADNIQFLFSAVTCPKWTSVYNEILFGGIYGHFPYNNS